RLWQQRHDRSAGKVPAIRPGGRVWGVGYKGMRLRHPTPHTLPPAPFVLAVLCLTLSWPAAGQSVRLHADLGQARAALRAGQPAIAAALARRALDRDPADLSAGVLLGLSLEAQGRDQEAVAALAAVISAGQPSSTSSAHADAMTALARLLPA